MITITLLTITLAAPGPEGMPRVEISKDGKGFVLDPSGKPFVPWGFNYGNAGRLIEDFWEKDWPTVEADWRDMKAMGANVVRVHLQFAKFMDAPDRPDPKALDLLAKLVALSERVGLYLDITGLACYRAADVPPWYDVLEEPARWSAQAKFWESVADRCKESPAIFCYDLMNEPLSPGERRKPDQWYSGAFGGYNFLQFISNDPAGRPRPEVARLWIKALSAAIRKHDARHLITVGMLPSTPAWGHFSGFVPKEVAPELGFVSVHVYPESKKDDEALKTLEGFAVGKPVVVEETFNLSCSIAEAEDFLRRSRPIAQGWIGHYDGQTIEHLEDLKRANKLAISGAIYLDWLLLSRRLAPEFTGVTPSR